MENEPVDRQQYDVVCFGGGGEGVAAATTAAQRGAKVVVLCKEPLGYGNTRISYGIKTHPGIVEGDSKELLYEDMLRGGDYLNNPGLARVVADESVMSSAMLEGYGYIFRRDERGLLSNDVLRRSGGHSLPRSIMPYRYGGVPIGQALRSAASRSSLEVREEVAVTRLLVERGRVRGVVTLDLRDGHLDAIGAKAVVIATGGAGWLYYPHTDCMRVSTGDGYGLALAAGAELVDMEQVQFIPFGLTYPRSMLGLFVGEPSFAGRYGRLLDSNHDVVATDIHVMTRARLSVIISREVEQGRGAEHGGLLLDLSANFKGADGAAALQRAQKTPNFGLVKRAYGLRAFNCEEPWEVLPSAHFSMGGVVIDECGRTAVQGLYAAGEAAGGIHGGNRLGSMALSDIFIIGRRSGEAAAIYAEGADEPGVRRDDVEADRDQVSRWHTKAGTRPVELVRRLQHTMWENVGLVRDEVKGQRALREIEQLEQESAAIGFPARPGCCTDLRDAVELGLMLEAARAIALSSLQRRESRGAHARSDYPERDDRHWLANIVVRSSGHSMRTTVRPCSLGAEVAS